MQDYLARRWFFLLLIITVCVATRFRGWTDNTVALLSTHWITATNLLLMAVSLRTKSLKEAISRPGPAAISFAITMGLAPLAAMLLARGFLSGNYQIGMIVVGCLP